MIPGFRVGQATDMAHQYLLAKGLPEGKTFEDAMIERVKLYVALLTKIDKIYNS